MKKEKQSLYIQMVLELSAFIIRVAGKDNPTPTELNAMSEMAKLLFKTL